MATRSFIPRTPAIQPGRAVEPRDITELSRRVSELSEQLAAETRPHLSSMFIDRVDGEPELGVALTSTALNGVVHGLGRAYRGWHLAGLNAAAIVYEDMDADVDRAIYLPLRCTVDCTVRLIIW